MFQISKACTCILVVSFLPAISFAQGGGSFVINKDEVEAVFKQGLEGLAQGKTVSDIVVRHVDVGDEYMGVSVVQRSKVEAGSASTAISHVDLDEIYYIVTGEGTMLTGGTFVDAEATSSELLGNGHRGTIVGGVMQKVKPGDIAIIPKGMPHGWHEIVTDSIGYVIFRADPNQVMNEKYE